MSVEVITTWYNEEFLAPFFLKHYAWVDRIIVLLDKDSDDNSLAFAKEADNTTIIPIEFPDGIDEKIKVRFINEAYAQIKSDFVIAADADEFVFCGPEDFIPHEIEWKAAHVNLSMLYRHVSESDLDLNKPIVEQRRHGIQSWPYNKPIVVAGKQDLTWSVGNHTIKVDGVSQPYYFNKSACTIPHRKTAFKGAHWANADPCFAIQRRLRSKMRQSRVNMKKKYSMHNHDINRQMLIDEYKKHENDKEIL